MNNKPLVTLIPEALVPIASPKSMIHCARLVAVCRLPNIQMEHPQANIRHNLRGFDPPSDT